MSAVLGGSGGTSVIAQAIAGLAAPFLTDAVGNWMTDQAQSPQNVHPNHDLQHLVGDAVQLVLVTAASRQSDPSVAKSLRQLAESSHAAFDRVKRLSRYNGITEGELPSLFATAVRGNDDACKVLTRSDWKLFVNVLARDARIDDPRAISTAASSLHAELYAAIRELLKRDFATGGRRFAALTLDMNANMLRRLVEISASRKELAVEIRAIRKSVDAVVSARIGQLPNQEELRPWFEEFRNAELALDRALVELRSANRGIGKLMENFRLLGRRLVLQHHLAGRRNDQAEKVSTRQFHVLAGLICGGLVLGCVSFFYAFLNAKASLDRIDRQTAEAKPAVTRYVERLASGNAEDAPVVTHTLTRVQNLGGRAQLGAVSKLGAPAPLPSAPANRPNLDIREKAELLAKSKNPQEKVMGLLVLQRNSEAAVLIAAQQAHSDASPEQAEFWMLMDARNLAEQDEIVDAIHRYKEIINRFPEASIARAELIDVYMRPALGMRGHPGRPFSPEEVSRRVGDPSTYPGETIAQIQVLLGILGQEEVSSRSAYLHFRYGVALQLQARNQNKPSPDEAVREFKMAAKHFYSQGMPFMEVASLHQAGVSNLYCANRLYDSEGSVEEGPDFRRFSSYVADAVACLQSALGIAIPDENEHVSELTYVVRSRLAHAYILDPEGDRASHIRAALAILKDLSELNDRYGFGDLRIPILETFAYQSLAKFENRKENLLNAVMSSKKQNLFRFNARGEMVYPNPDGSEFVSTMLFTQLTFDFGEPAIKFTCFRDWLREGGTYEQYLLLIPEKTT